MSEEKLTAIGIQISRDGAQVSWYDSLLQEPQTIASSGEGENGFTQVSVEAWKGVTRGERFGVQAMSRCIVRLIEMIPGEVQFWNICLCVTVPELSREMGRHLSSCLEGLGIRRKFIFLQDWRTSFYYYVLSRKKELWNGDVAFIRKNGQKMVGSILHIDRSVRPCSASILEIGAMDVSEQTRDGRNDSDWDRERDRLLYELLGKLFERRTVSTTYIYGTYFDRGWAERSFQYLTFRRYAFQGQNLFSIGACCAAMAKAGLLTMPDVVYKGADMISEDFGMRIRVRGREKYILLLMAGVSWYEAYRTIEIIPDGEKSVTVLTVPTEGGKIIGHVLRLDHFPERPNRATRLRMTIYFTCADCCVIEVEDLGFGDFYPPSGKIWRREVAI